MQRRRLQRSAAPVPSLPNSPFKQGSSAGDAVTSLEIGSCCSVVEAVSESPKLFAYLPHIHTGRRPRV